MSSPILEGSSDFDSTTRKHDKRESWTEEQRAFAVYHKDLGAPVPAVASLLNAKFELSRRDSAVAKLIRRVCKVEGEKKRLLEVANRQPWKKTTNEERNASNRTALGRRVYSDEQRSYAMYYSARGFSVKQIVPLFNEQFSMDVSILNLDKLIWRTRVKENEGGEALRAAEQYSWYTEPVPEENRPSTPTQPVQESTNDSAAIFQEKYHISSRDWTKEQKAFVIHHDYRCMKEDALIELFNSTFPLNRKKQGLQVVLKHIWKDDKLVTHLRQHAQQFDWYTPEAAPGTPQSLKTEKAQRMREARKRISVKKEFLTKVPKDGDFSRFLQPGQTEHVRRSLLDSGSYSSRPIKIEDSDDDDDNVLSTSRLRQIPSTFDGGCVENLPNVSPLAIRTTSDRTQNSKSEFHGDTTLGISSFRQSEPRQSNVSGGYNNDLLSASPLAIRTTNDRTQNDQYANNVVSSSCDEDLLSASPTTLRMLITKLRREAHNPYPFISSESPLTQRTAGDRILNVNRESNVTTSRRLPEDLSAASHFSAGQPPSSVDRSFRPNTDFNPSGMNRSFRPNANLNSSSVNHASRPNVSVDVNTPSVNYYSRPLTVFHPSASHSAYGPPTMSAYSPPLTPNPNTIPLPLSSPHSRGHNIRHPPSSHSAYGPPITSAYGPPTTSAYGQPTSSAYDPPTTSAYGQPTSSAYGPPTMSAYDPPTMSAHGPPTTSAHGPPTTSAYGPRLIQIPNPTPIPTSSPHSRGVDVLHDWAPLSPRFAPAIDYPAPGLERRSRSPRKEKDERFMFGDEDDEEDEKGVEKRDGMERKGERAASRYREPLGRYEDRR